MVALLGGEVQGVTSIELFAKSVGARLMPAFRRLILKGYSPGTKIGNPRVNALQDYISQSDAEAFHSKFYTLRSMSLLFDRSWQSLTADLTDAGIKPFSPDRANYGNVFLKDEVDQHLGWEPRAKNHITLTSTLSTYSKWKK